MTCIFVNSHNNKWNFSLNCILTMKMCQSRATRFKYRFKTVLKSTYASREWGVGVPAKESKVRRLSAMQMAYRVILAASGRAVLTRSLKMPLDILSSHFRDFFKNPSKTLQSICLHHPCTIHSLPWRC